MALSSTDINMKMKLLITGITFFLSLYSIAAQPSTNLMVNVESYGAVANGTTDNSNAIANAISALHPGQTLFFPCTTGQFYLVKSPINFGSLKNIHLEGSGSGCDLSYAGSTYQPAAFNFVGAWSIDVRNMDFYSSNGILPQTILMLGRPTPNSQSGQFKFTNVRVEGWATKAIVYSIASEENSWIAPTIIINGGGASYAFYTSWNDDLGVANLPQGSNLSLWMQNFHLFDFSPNIDPTHSLIYDEGNSSGAGNHTYRDGYLASGNGTGFSFGSSGSYMTVWMGLTVDSNRFEDGYQMFNFTGGGSFGDIALTNNKSAGVSKYMINLPSTCYDCTIQGNNVQQGDHAVSSIGTLENSYVSENYPVTVQTVINSHLFDRLHGTVQVSSGALPACSSANEGTIGYLKGSGKGNGSLQVCQYFSGNYRWIAH